MSVSIRRMKKHEDAHQFRKNVNAMVAENARIHLDAAQTLKQEKEWLTALWKLVEKDLAKVWIAQDFSRAIGIAEARKGYGREKRNVEIRIGLNREHRGKGIGKALIQKSIQDAKKWNAKTIWLSVLEGNETAIALYRKMGFKTIARLPLWADVNGKREDKLIMVLQK